MAAEFGVSPRTIRNDGKLAEALDKISDAAGPAARQEILSKETPLTRQAVTEIADKPKEEIPAALETAKKESKQRKPQLYTSNTEEWYTPSRIIDRVILTLGAVDLDPCCNPGEPNVPASKHYREEDDGLSHPWGGRVFMNPPYGSALPRWVKQLVAEYEAGRVSEAVALIPARPDTRWFRALREFPRCFIWGRLKFSGGEKVATFPSMAVYLGNNLEGFVKAFSDIGDIYGLIA